jgi:hypothetical protein
VLTSPAHPPACGRRTVPRAGPAACRSPGRLRGLHASRNPRRTWAIFRLGQPAAAELAAHAAGYQPGGQRGGSRHPGRWPSGQRREAVAANRPGRACGWLRPRWVSWLASCRGTEAGAGGGLQRHVFGACLVNDWSARDIRRSRPCHWACSWARRSPRPIGWVVPPVARPGAPADPVPPPHPRDGPGPWGWTPPDGPDQRLPGQPPAARHHVLDPGADARPPHQPARRCAPVTCCVRHGQRAGRDQLGCLLELTRDGTEPSRWRTAPGAPSRAPRGRDLPRGPDGAVTGSGEVRGRGSLAKS